MVKITLNGQVVEAAEHSNILTIAKENGIDIPNLCYEKYLTVFSGCRICVVEVEGRRNLVAACSTKPTEGMVIETHSPRVMSARRQLLDLMYSNHSVDCLSCSKVGECKLQDYCFQYGIKEGSYKGAKKNYAIDDANPAFLRDQNKCILCGKCVAVCSDIQVTSTIDFIGRGFDTKVTTAFDKPISTDNCRICGQCVSACPTGALMNKQLMTSRPWDRKKVRTTCPFCGVGCNFDLNVVGNKVVGVTPNENSTVNALSTCIKGRFHIDLITSEDRITKPLIKRNGVFEEATYEEAMELVISKFKEIKNDFGSDALAGLSSARCTNEDNYIFQKLFRAALGTNNVDHCART